MKVVSAVVSHTSTLDPEQPLFFQENEATTPGFGYQHDSSLAGTKVPTISVFLLLTLI